MSRTDICSFSFSQIWEPPMEMAWGEAVTRSSQPIRPPSMASITSSSVITLVTEAGSYWASAFCSHRTFPVVFSIKMAEGAVTSAGAA